MGGKPSPVWHRPLAWLDFDMRILSLFLALAAATSAPLAAQTDDRPALVVLITVDQLRPDYFPRFDADLTGGLRRFYDQGAFYARGEQDHAITETAPGHATMLTGRSPGSVGVVSNNLGVPDPDYPLLGVPGPGASPARFRGTTLYDWMAAADRDTRVLSISRKDRGAILPIGRAKVPVYWFQGGYFTTSTWYDNSLPAWLQKWNDRKPSERLAGLVWDLFLPADRYQEPDSQPWERGGAYATFPYPLPTDTTAVAGWILAIPWADSLVIDVALEGVRALGLGTRGHPDLLSVSLSATDAVGHGWGPDSREIHDQIVRLDHWMGWFMDSLATLVPREKTLYILTSDHGVSSYPERNASLGRMGGRVSGDRVLGAAEESLQARHGQTFELAFDNGLIYGNVGTLKAAGIDVDSLSAALASGLALETGVTRVLTPRTLAAADAADREAGRWGRTIPSDFEWLAAASVAPGYIWTYPTHAIATHGTTTSDDVTVPIAFMGKGITPARLARARTVDIAPTIAALLKIQPLETVEGQVLKEVVPPRH